ncbi:MAG: polymer-forming cytoskeletal protein [Rhodospirillaceae bacterium]|nr:polymer-forming cytoskeletal protein [Rhodospirillaceae bacterium]
MANTAQAFQETEPHAPQALRQGSARVIPTMVGQGVRISGDLVCDGALQIDGTVEGDVCADSVTVGPTGTVIGTLSAREVLVLGAVTGRVQTTAMTIARNAKVMGDLLQETICIEPGANFEGTCRHVAARAAALPAPEAKRLPAPEAGA